MPVTRGRRVRVPDDEVEDAAQAAAVQLDGDWAATAAPAPKRQRAGREQPQPQPAPPSPAPARRRGKSAALAEDEQVARVAESPRRGRRLADRSSESESLQRTVVVEQIVQDGEYSRHTEETEQQLVEAEGAEVYAEDDAPPMLEAEAPPHPEEVLLAEMQMMENEQIIQQQDYTTRQQSAGQVHHYMVGDQTFATQEEAEAALLAAQQATGVEEGAAAAAVAADLRTVEFNFLDNKNICCGLCGEIVPYDQLMADHLPNQHPEVLGEGDMTMEEIPYEEWLREKLRAEKRAIESGFKLTSFEAPARVHRTANRLQRRVSQIRVNPAEMSLVQLDAALKKKMVEKMGRKVPVTLVDKQHARCGLCNAVVSLNKKFEVVHLVRHFNAWHPSAHRCAGNWAHRAPTRPTAKPLSLHDFAVIDSNNTTPDNLQCIWCGMFMDTDSLAMHFDEVHPDDIEVPKCNLCVQELVLNARMQEKYGEDFEITLPDEHHIRCNKFGATFTSEAALERGIERRLNNKSNPGEADGDEDDDEMLDEDMEDVGPEAFLNSRMSLGRRKKPKRQFIMPALRQAAPIDSEYVEPVTECHWRCKMCRGDILAAVISAGAIKHYRTTHPEHLDSMQYELCKARLERVSDGCMEFVHPQLIECLLCNMTYNLHKPFNMCRAIRHLKSKHPNLMPEYAGVTPRPPMTNQQTQKQGLPTRRGGEGERDVELRVVDDLEQLKETYGIDISKMQSITGADGEQVYVIMPEGEDMDPAMAGQLAAAMASGDAFTERGADDTSTRVYTLSLGGDKPTIAPCDDGGAGTSDAPPPLRNEPQPMPEPLTTE